MANVAHDLFLAPGELLLASTGLTVALRPGPVRINQQVLGRANPTAMEKAIRRRLLRWLRGQEYERKEPPEFDYDEITDLLPQMLTEARNVENVGGFETQALADAYAAQLGNAVGYVLREIPDKIQPMVIGGQRITAPDHEIAGFRRKYRVIEDPLIVLDHLAAGWLLDDEVETLATVYPAIYGAIRGCVLEALVTVATEKKGWRLPFAKDLQLGILLQQTRLDGEVHAALLKRWEEKRAEESKGVKQPQHQGRKGIGDPSTPSERLEAR